MVTFDSNVRFIYLAQFSAKLMKKLILFILFLSLPLQTVVAQKTITDSLVSGGSMRYYHVYIPKNFIVGSSRPLIIHLHGYGSNAQIEQNYTNYMPIADTAGFLVVYPEGTKDGNGYQYWTAGIPTLPTTLDDVAFLSALIDTLHTHYNVNTTRIYASGLSNGGYMCYQLAWKLPNRIAAIASVSGSMAPLEFAKCKPTQAVPIMEIHGTADQTVPYTGSVLNTDIDTLMNFWVLNDHCIPLPGVTNLPDIDKTDGTTVIHYQWSAELANTTCELYKIINGAHVDWPGATGAGNNGDFSASAAIWQFFNKYQNQTAGIKAEKNIPSSISFYPNPCSDVLHIGSYIQGKITIVDITGRQVLTSHEKDIDISKIPSGLYLLEYENGSTHASEKLLKY